MTRIRVPPTIDAAIFGDSVSVSAIRPTCLVIREGGVSLFRSASTLMVVPYVSSIPSRSIPVRVRAAGPSCARVVLVSCLCKV